MNPVIQLAIATILLGIGGLFIKIAELPPLVMGFFRAGIPLACVVSWFLMRREPLLKGVTPFILLASGLDAIRAILFVVGFSAADLSSGVLILYTWPLFAMLLSTLFLKERIPRRNILLLPCFIGGIIVIYGNGEFSLVSDSSLGLTSILLSAMLSATTVVMYKAKSNDFSGFHLIFYQNLMAALVTLPFLLTNRPWPTLFQASLGIAFGLIVGFAAFVLLFSALSQLKASTAALLCYLEVLSTMAVGLLILREPFTSNLALGASLILGGSIFLKKEA